MFKCYQTLATMDGSTLNISLKKIIEQCSVTLNLGEIFGALFLTGPS